MLRKIVPVVFIIGLMTINTGCKLVNSPLGSNKGENAASSEEPVKNPSDHIFDINLERVKKDLTGKKLGNIEPNWELKAEDILEAEFGGSNLAQNKMESLYYLLLKKSGTEEKYESAVYFNYDWTNNDWVLKGTKQAYIERLEGENNKVAREVREQKITEYQNRPPEVPTPEIPPVPENTTNNENPEMETNEEAESPVTENTEAEVIEDTEGNTADTLAE